MVRKIGLVALFVVLVFFTACSKTDSTVKDAAVAAKQYSVNFLVDGSVYKTVLVNAETRVSEPEAPSFADPTKHFVQWETENGKPWNFKVGIVNSDLNLIAGYKVISEKPSDLAMKDEGLTSKLTWTQGVLWDSYEIVIVDSQGASARLEGNYELDEASSKVVFTPSVVPQGGLYSVTLKAHDEVLKNDNLIFCGEGTRENPYLIADARDFYALSRADIGEGTYYSLYSNITIEPFRADQEGYEFNGILLGNGRTITLENANCGAIYRIGEKGTVSKLNIAGSISTVKDSVGALADYNAGRIENVTTTAQVESTSGLVGSINIENTLNDKAEDGKRGIAGLIVGTNLSSGVIDNCKIATESTTTGRLIANIASGGIAGLNQGLITHCTGEVIVGGANAILSSKSLSRYSYCGGIAGINDGVIEYCSLSKASKLLAQRYLSADGVVEGTNNSNIGGIAGLNMGSGIIQECSFTGMRVHGDENVGGIAGDNQGLIKSCLVAGTTHGFNTDFLRTTYIAGRLNVGGIAGLDSGIVEDCMVSANVFGFTKSDPAYYISSQATNGFGPSANPDGQEENLTGAINSDYGSSGGVYSEKENLAELVYPASYSAMDKAPGSFIIVDGIPALLWTTQGPAEATIDVELYNSDGSPFASVKVGESPSTLTKAYEIGSVFEGWALKQGEEVVLGPDAKVNLYDIQGYAHSDNKVHLYAIMTEVVYEAKVKVAVWGRYFDQAGYQELMSNAEAYVNGAYQLSWEYLDDATYHGVADFGKAVNQASDFDVIVGSGTNISTTGGVPAVAKAALKADITSLEPNRQAAVLRDSSYALDFYGYLCGIEDKNALVAFYPDTQDFARLNSTLNNSITIPSVQGAIGWSNQESSQEAIITSDSLVYSDVEALLVDGGLVLYPVFKVEEEVQEPAAESNSLKVAVWTKDGDWITQEEKARIAQRFAKALLEEGIDLAETRFFIEDITTEGNKVADLGAKTNEGAYDIIVGCGNNINSTAGVSILKKAALPASVVGANRMVALITENTLAQKLYDFLLLEDDSQALKLEVAVWTKNGSWVTDDELKAIKTGYGKLVNGLGLEVNYTIITTEGNKVADLGAKTNEGSYDIIIGCGNNVDSSGAVAILEKADIKSEVVAAGRKVALLKENAFARLMYSWMI